MAKSITEIKTLVTENDTVNIVSDASGSANVLATFNTNTDTYSDDTWLSMFSNVYTFFVLTEDDVDVVAVAPPVE